MNPTNYFEPINKKQVSTGTRLGSMFIDHFIMTFIAVGFFVPGIIYEIFSSFNEPNTNMDLFGKWIYFGLVGFAIYFCKDCINGRSPAKRILKLQVLDNKTNLIASPLKCLARNISCIIWPVEVIMVLANPSRRLGDYIAGTKVAIFDPEVEQPKNDFKKIILPFLLMYGLLITTSFPFISVIGKNSEHVVESSYNPTKSKTGEEYLNKELGGYLTASLKIYDKVENKNIRYVYITLRLKENYFRDDNSFNELKNKVTPLIYETFPHTEFDGYIKFIYNEGLNYHQVVSRLY